MRASFRVARTDLRKAADERPILLIPAYKPMPCLYVLLKDMLESEGFAGAIVVDDGSGPGFVPIFERCRSLPNVTVVTHPRNEGKGAALKTGLRVAADGHRTVGVVTADADGQHLADDVARVARALESNPTSLVLGARTFGQDVPLRSRFGNLLTRRVLRFVSGQRLSDTQTGLRGIPRAMIADLLTIEANGYEFELDMLLRCPPERAVREVAIRTVYIDENASSHFDPLFDSMRIYLVLLRFLLASLSSALVDNLVFFIAYLFLPNIALCHALGRATSLGVNFTLNRKAVFKSRDEVVRTLPRYLALCLVSGAVGYAIIRGLVAVGMPVLPAKLTAESLLFFLNFVALRKIVFAR